MKSILTEFIEIYVNQIIYIRKVYPRQIFQKRKAFCLPVNKSIYPPLNEYVQKSLICSQHLIGTKELKRVEILIYDDNGTHESYMMNFLEDFLIDESDLMILQENFRQSLCELEIKCKVLNEIKQPSKFKILLHTKERAYQKLCNDSTYQDFLWRQVNEINKSAVKKIIPISTCDCYSLHIETN